MDMSVGVYYNNKKEANRMEALLNEIETKISAKNQDEILKAVIRGWNREHPRDELVWISLPKGNREERRRILEYVCCCLIEEA